MLPSGRNLNRKSWPLVILLLMTLAGARWAAKELPLRSDHVIRSVTWVDDRFVMISEVARSGRWGAPHSSRLFLYDCQDRKWIDLQSKLAIKEFARRQPFRSPDKCFCFFDRQSRLFKLNPSDEQAPIETWSVDSAHGIVVGNRYYIFQGSCLDVVSGKEFALPDFSSGSVAPVNGADSIVVTYHSSGADRYYESGSGMGMYATPSNEDSINLETDQTLQESSIEAPMQQDAVITQDFSVEYIDRPEFLHYEWYDFHIQQQAMKSGRIPSELGLRVLYSIEDEQFKQLAIWAADETLFSGPESSRGVIVDHDASGQKIELRQGNTGQLLNQIGFPFGPFKDWRLSDGVLLFDGPTHRSELAVDVRDCSIVPLPKDIFMMAKSDNYAVCWHASVWSPGVYHLQTGEQIQDLRKLDFHSPEFTQDGQSLKLLMSNGDIRFLNLKTGQVQVHRPLLFREWLCWIVGGLVVACYVVWLSWCHQRQISIQSQGTACALFAALVSWWRLDLMPTEIVKERPAFFVLVAAIMWLGYVAIGKLLSIRFPWYLKVFLAQLGYYAWYFFCFKPKSNESEALTAIIAMYGFLICVAVVQFRKRHNESSATRFSLTSILIVTALIAVAIHQIRLVPWQPILRIGVFYQSSILLYSVVCASVLLATWLSKNAYRFPKISVVLAATGLVAVLFGRDTMSWYALEYDVTWYGSDSYQILLCLIRWLIFAGSVFCLGWNFSKCRAKSNTRFCA